MKQDIIQGDSLESLQIFANDSIDLLCTDPPYGYSFMGKVWDKTLPDIGIFKECFRVLKPGAFAFVMSAPRSDVCARMMILLEDAGFNIGFTPIYWTYASGFPKAMNIGKMIDKREGAERETVEGGVGTDVGYSGGFKPGKAVSAKAVSLNGSYGGFQPKPAVEVVIVAMKPLSEKTYVDQALRNGKGITWLDYCRIPTDWKTQYPESWFKSGKSVSGEATYQGRLKTLTETTVEDRLHEGGRFPANLLVENSILDIVNCTCSTHEENIPIVKKDLNSDEPGTRENQKQMATSLFMDDLEARKQNEKSPKPSRSTKGRPNTEQQFQQAVSPSLTESDVNQSEALTATAPIENGWTPLENETGINAYGVAQLKTSTSTTSNPSPSTPSFGMKSRTVAFCALHATGRPQPTESSQGYSRFFSLDAWAKTLPFLIVPKASKREKNKGLDGFEKRVVKTNLNANNGSGERLDGAPSSVQQNFHPTVKPLTLMSYLITLGSRPGDVVLDPFLGSGTTAIAAKQLGRQFIGIEREKEYIEIAEARLSAVAPSLF